MIQNLLHIRINENLIIKIIINFVANFECTSQCFDLQSREAKNFYFFFFFKQSKKNCYNKIEFKFCKILSKYQ